MLKEKQIEKNILAFLEEVGIHADKVQSTGIFDTKKNIFRSSKGKYTNIGMSDIIGILPNGRYLAIEVKSKTGRPSEHQLKFITTINASKGVAFIARSVEQVYDSLSHFWPDIDKFIHILKKYQQMEKHEEEVSNRTVLENRFDNYTSKKSKTQKN